MIFRDADHMVFTGRVWPGRDPSIDVEIHRLMKACTTLFLDAYLRGDSVAKEWLQGEGMRSLLGAEASVEKK